MTIRHAAHSAAILPHRRRDKMDLIDRLRELSARIPKQLPLLKTEEATKNALVMPLINALGYDVFDPNCVVPEYTADVGTKKGEKVDYVILDEEGKPIILIECKTASANLDQEHASQLYRYFSVTEARFGVLTNGVDYKFFSDLEAPNKMDSRPFLEFSLLDVTPGLASELKKFAKDSFDLSDILSTASELKYTKGMKKALTHEWTEPSAELVRLLTSRVYSGRLTQGVMEQFTALTKKALSEFLSDRVSERLNSALERESAENASEGVAESAADELVDDDDDGIVTTGEEWEAFYAVKAILRNMVDAKRIVMRDRKRYCAILLDNTHRKPICRLHFNSAQKYFATFAADRTETKHPISSVDDIFKFTEEIRKTVNVHEGNLDAGTQSSGT